VKKRQDARMLFVLFAVILTAIAALRYGTGVDYFSYRKVYNLMPETTKNLKFKFYWGFEPAYSYLNIFCRSLGLDFYGFNLFYASATLFLYLYLIRKYSEAALLSFFIFFANYYLVYVTSAIR
jgi:hypothetical protein